jgi:hypothetical protein
VGVKVKGPLPLKGIVLTVFSAAVNVCIVALNAVAASAVGRWTAH